MLVEINLLPKKKIKNRATFAVVILLLVIALVCSTVVFAQVSEARNEERRLSNQLVTIEKTREILERKISTNEDANSVIKLEQAVNWADDYVIESVPLVRHLSSLLPERGFIQSFSYVDAGVVSCEIQFDSNSQVAQYLAVLKDSNYLNQVKLNSVTTVTHGDTEADEETPVNEEREDVLPRYIAQFELTINKQELKTAQKEGN